MVAMRRIICSPFGHSEPIRQPLGGWRCSSCMEPAASLDELGWGDGYVRPDRDTFTRDGEQQLLRGKRAL